MPLIGSVSGSSGFGRGTLAGAPSWITAAGSIGTLNDNQRGNTLSVQASPGPGAVSVTYSVASGSLPTGASLNGSTGVISGFGPVSSNTTSSFTVRATNNVGLTADRAFSITINAVTITFNSPAAGAFAGQVQNTAFNQTYSATVSSGTVTYASVSGTIPSGTSINSSNGAHTGTLSSAASFSWTVRATGTSGAVSVTVDRAFSIVVAAPVVSMSGGTTSTYVAGGNTYRQHIFTSNGTLTVSSGGTAEVLVVGGGGGGGMLGAGGGGGGVVVATGTVTPGNYSVVRGGGGAGQIGWVTSGNIARKGGNSSVFGVTAYGGGGARSYSSGGAASENQGVANYGGLGNGQTSYGSVGASFAPNNLPGGWSGTVSAGRVGGTGSTSCCPCMGGGGGGAGQNGTNNNNSTGSKGGDGVIPTLNGVPMYNNQNFWFGGGGPSDGYCSRQAGTPGRGGAGGAGVDGGSGSTNGDTNGINPGGNGQRSGSSPSGTRGWGGNGGTNTGGGGGAGSNGGGSTSVRGGTGGSGIVVVRYRI